MGAELSVLEPGIHLHQVFDLGYAATGAEARTVSTTTPHVVFGIFYYRQTSRPIDTSRIQAGGQILCWDGDIFVI